MKVGGTATRTIWLEPDGAGVGIIDQTPLPVQLEKRRLIHLDGAAPLIGAPAPSGMSLAMRADPSDAALEQAAKTLLATRPTAVNLRWAVEDLRALLATRPPTGREAAAYARASQICEEDVVINRAIAGVGLPLIQKAWEKKG